MVAPSAVPVFFVLWQIAGFNPADLDKARDAQTRGALEGIASQFSAAAERQPNDVQTQYRLALAAPCLAEVAMETGDKNAARSAAETGMKAGEEITGLKPGVAGYQRVLGTLCGQVIPANVLMGMRYGPC